MKITLSAGTPAEARNLLISFRFSEYSCTGTCCWGFLSAQQQCCLCLKQRPAKMDSMTQDRRTLNWTLPSSEQSLAPKKTVTAAILVSPEFWLLIRRGRIILAHLELYPDSPLFTTSHFLQTNHKIQTLTKTTERTSAVMFVCYFYNTKRLEKERKVWQNTCIHLESL